jgi:hypothetical protein
MKTFKLISGYALMLIFFTSNAQASISLDSLINYLIGGWKWCYSYGGWSNNDPASAGYTKTIYFEKTEGNNPPMHFYLLKNDTLIFHHDIVLSERTVSDKKEWFIDSITLKHPSFMITYILMHESTDTLLFHSWSCWDCYDEYFARDTTIKIDDMKTKLTLEETAIRTDGRLTISPNPSDDKILVSSENIISAIEIYDLNGKKVFNENYLTNSFFRFVNVQNLKNGPYILKAITPKTAASEIFMKQ